MCYMLFVIKAGTNIAVDKPYVKDGIARIFTEVIKREWPQQWPDLISTLSDICSKSVSEEYLVYEYYYYVLL